MDTKHFKIDFSVKKSTSLTPLLSTVSKLYYTYYHLRLSMIVCIVLIWFFFTVLHESGNLDAIFIVCRKIQNKISNFFLLTPAPLLGQKPIFFSFSFLPFPYQIC